MRSLALCDLVSHTSFVLAALRALHVDSSGDSSGAVEVMAGTEEGRGLSRAV
jgi:hypothetical protein